MGSGKGYIRERKKKKRRPLTDVEMLTDEFYLLRGAVYGIDTGILYASDNGSGEIWSFPVNGSDVAKVTDEPRSGSNDGARCVLNVLS